MAKIFGNGRRKLPVFFTFFLSVLLSYFSLSPPTQFFLWGESSGEDSAELNSCIVRIYQYAISPLEFLTTWSVWHMLMLVAWTRLVILTLTTVTRIIGVSCMAQSLLSGTFLHVSCSPRFRVSCSVQCLLTMEDENWLMCWLPRSWGICYGSLTCMWHIEWKMVSLSVASGERWVASQTAVKSFSSWGYCDLLGQENTRIKIERPVLSPWLFCQHPSWPWLNHLPLLDVTTWWSWRWYLSAVCTSVLPGISPYIEPGQVYGCCFFSSSSSDLHSVLFVTLASEKKDQVHGPPFP